jgi:hypothetical protein
LNSVSLSSGAKSLVLMHPEKDPAGVFTGTPTLTTLERSSATPGARSLLEGVADLRICGHEDPRIGSLPAREPLALVADDVAILYVVDVLAHVEDGSVLALCVVVEGVLHELTVLEVPYLDDRRLDPGNHLHPLEEARLHA